MEEKDTKISKIDLPEYLLEESDPEKAKDIINMFNLNFAKKSAIRLDTLSNLIDDVIEKVRERLTLRSDEFTNKDLIDYLSALYQAAEKSGKIAEDAHEIPSITLNQQNNVIVNTVDSLTSESKARITDAVNSIINNIKLQEELKNDRNSEETEPSDGN